MSNRINTIVGKNGSGKSTILKILANFENAGFVSGKVEMNDMDYFKNRFEVYESKILLSSTENTLFDKELTVFNLYRFIGELYCDFRNYEEKSQLLDK
jgi:ABC-type multidrug transport system ATPase subunit